MMRKLIRVFVLTSIQIALMLTFAVLPSLHAATIPTTPGWFQIPHTILRNVCPPNDFGGSSYDFWDNCRFVVEAWNSAVFDTRRNRLIVWGGGHADYLGNELYAVDLTALSVSRLTAPALPVVTSGCQETIGSQPNSRHTYDGIAYMANVDRMFVFGGALSPCGFMSNGTWLFHFATATWQRMQPTGPIPNAVPGVVSAYDPHTGNVFLHDDTYLYAYNFGTNSYQRLSGNNPIDYHMTATIDPVRKKFVIIGAGQVYTYNLSPGSTYIRQTVNTTGGHAIVSSAYPGLAYDPTTDRIVAWNGGNTVYSLNLDTGVWATTTYTGGPGAAPAAGTYKRWSYAAGLNAFVVVNSMLTNVYIFRLSEGGSPVTPLQPPTNLTVR